MLISPQHPKTEPAQFSEDTQALEVVAEPTSTTYQLASLLEPQFPYLCVCMWGTKGTYFTGLWDA